MTYQITDIKLYDSSLPAYELVVIVDPTKLQEYAVYRLVDGVMELADSFTSEDFKSILEEAHKLSEDTYRINW